MKQEQLHRIHQCEIRILDELDRICKKHNLTYYMVGGTLLGAVRHGGFIPWDDDMDLAMPRRDYNKLLKVAETELAPEFFLQTMYNELEYENRFAKLRLNNTAFVEETSEGLNRHQGIFIDVWPLDYGPEKITWDRKLRAKLITTLCAKIRRISNKNHRDKGDPIKDRIIFAMLSVFSREKLIRMMERLMQGEGDCYVNWASHYGWKKQTMRITVYDPPVKLMFEGKEYSAPGNYEYWLNRIFGKNYMELPPVEKRETHNPIRLSFDTNGPDEVLN